MLPNLITQNLQSVFFFPFQDPEWFKKLAIGTLVTLAGFIIPILPLIFLYGYVMRVMERIIVQDGEPYLPEWDDWGKLFNDGVRLIGAGLIYALPVLIMMFIGFAFSFFPAIIVSAMDASGATASSAFALIPVFGALITFGIIGIGVLLTIAIGFLVPAALGHLVAKDSFAAAFRVKEWWPIFRTNISGFVMAYLLVLVISTSGAYAIQLLYITIILCWLVPFVLSAFSTYLALVMMALFSQAYRDGVHKLEINGESPP